MSTLFEPIKIGNLELSHRVVLAPLTRMRTLPSGGIKTDLVKEYYEQRASVPGTLLITEGTFITEQAAGFPGVPGFYSEEQIDAWKQVAEAVHKKGSYIYLQIAASGRMASDQYLKQLNPAYEVVGPSDDTVDVLIGQTNPRAMRIEEINEYVQWFTDAAKRAIDIGFDGVELHAANGALIDQFIQDVSNKREDDYGGSVEKRSRFVLEVVDAVTKAIGAERTSVRFSPFNTTSAMGMKDPYPQFTHIVTELKKSHPDLAYIHLIEPRVQGSEDLNTEQYKNQSNDFIREIWSPLPLISAGGWTGASAEVQAEEHRNELIAFGRHFIANPDLPSRLKNGSPLNKYDRSTFYTNEKEGYVDYPTL